jgi:hypothetical protein
MACLSLIRLVVAPIGSVQRAAQRTHGTDTGSW